MRETVEQKARRLLLTGKIQIIRVSGKFIEARIIGDNGIYQTTIWDGAYSCSCPYPHRTAKKECSHAKSLRIIWKPQKLKKAS